MIVATTRDDEEMVRVLDAGADNYVIRPFTAAQVRASTVYDLTASAK